MSLELDIKNFEFIVNYFRLPDIYKSEKLYQKKYKNDLSIIQIFKKENVRCESDKLASYLGGIDAGVLNM